VNERAGIRWPPHEPGTGDMTTHSTRNAVLRGIDAHLAGRVESAVEGAGYYIRPPARTSLGEAPGCYGPGSWQHGFDSTPSQTVALRLFPRLRRPRGDRIFRRVQAYVEERVRLRPAALQRHGYEQAAMVFGYRDRADGAETNFAMFMAAAAQALGERTRGEGHHTPAKRPPATRKDPL